MLDVGLLVLTISLDFIVKVLQEINAIVNEEKHYKEYSVSGPVLLSQLVYCQCQVFFIGMKL